MKEQDRLGSFLCLFDFFSVFPSVSHDFILRCLGHLRAPVGFQVFVRSLFQSVVAHCDMFGFRSFLFVVTSGVVQGDPLAAILFVCCLEPFLRLLDLRFSSVGLGSVYVCADDLATCVKNLDGLIILDSLFELFARASGLQLSHNKCILIPLHEKASNDFACKLRKWMQDHGLGKFACFQIAGLGEYFGMFVGPEAGGQQLLKTCEKYIDTCSVIAASSAPLL